MQGRGTGMNHSFGLLVFIVVEVGVVCFVLVETGDDASVDVGSLICLSIQLWYQVASLYES